MALLGLEDVHLPSLDMLGDDDWLQALDLSQPTRGCTMPSQPRSYYTQSASMPVPINRTGAGCISSHPRSVDYSSLESTQTILGSTPTVEPLLGAAAASQDRQQYLLSSADAASYETSSLAPSYAPYQHHYQHARNHQQQQEQLSLLDLDDLLVGQRPSYLPDYDLDVPPPIAADLFPLPGNFYGSHHPQKPAAEHFSASPVRQGQFAWESAPVYGRTTTPHHHQQQSQPRQENYGSVAGQHLGDRQMHYEDSELGFQQARFECCVHHGSAASMQMVPAYEEQLATQALTQQEQQQCLAQEHHNLLGCAEGEMDGMDSEHATEESDATMHVTHSPGVASPTSPNVSCMDTATAGAPGGHSSRTAAPLRRVSSLRSAGTASRCPQVRLRVVMKQQHQAGAAAGTTSACGSRRPRRAAALRSLVGSSYTDAYEDGEEDYEQAEDAAYESGGEGHSPVSLGRLGATAAAPATLQPNGKKKHNPWSQEETEALIEGVRLVGIGKWAEIKKLSLAAVAGMLLNRSAVDLKDKWRNLSRVARLPKSALKSRLAKGGSDTPLELVLAVKELLDSSRADHREWH